MQKKIKAQSDWRQEGRTVKGVVNGVPIAINLKLDEYLDGIDNDNMPIIKKRVIQSN